MTRKMVFVISALKGGGAEKFVLNLYRAMETYQGYECHIIAINKIVQHDVEGLRVHFLEEFCHFSKRGLDRIWYKEKTARAIDDYIIKNIGSDATILSNMLLADKIMSKSTLKVFHVIHSQYKAAFLDGKGLFRALLSKKKINRIYNNHPLIFVSKGAKEEFEIAFKSKFKNQVIYNPTERKHLQEKSIEPNNTDIYGDYFIHIGRFNRAKRHDRLIESFSKIKRKNVKLLLLGDGKLKNDIKEKVENLELTERIIFIGFQKNPYPYILNAKGLVLTSDFEGLPTVLIEAISLDVPVLTTNCSDGISEILGENSRSISPVDDTDQLTHNMDLLLDNREQFKSTFPLKFSAEEVSRQYHRLSSNISNE